MTLSPVKKLSLGISLLAIILAASVAASGQKRFYLAPDDHTDYYWTADEATYRQAFLTMIDYYLNKMDETQSNPSDLQMRWSCDGSLWMWEFEQNRSSAQFNRFIERVRDGHMSVPMNPLVVAQGGSNAESVLRGMLYSGRIERRYNLRFPMAVAMENQTMPYGLSSLWAGAGAKYSWKGVCNCATEVTGLNNRDREIYYSGGRDGSQVLMKWQSQYTTNKMFGSYIEADDPVATIGFADNSMLFQQKYPFSVIGAFGRGGDDLQYTSDEFIAVAQQQSTPGRRVIISNQEDFFRDFEASYGPQLETFSAAFGNEWDVLIASMAEVSSRVKRASEKLRSAEAMATLVALEQPSFMTSRIAERDRAMIDLGCIMSTTGRPTVRSRGRSVRRGTARSKMRSLSMWTNSMMTPNTISGG
ncbi:MAG: hypothetical protein IPN51_07380 [Chloracidobacterium sp.]|nr:hypothetical protein [Chloracidobacterium sp.]